jgi:anti-sigma B factor antagonist
MNLPCEIFGDVMVVHSPDDLGTDSAPGFTAFLDNADRKNIVLDLDGTEQIGSAGLEAMIDVQHRLRDIGGDMKIATTNRYNRKILEMTRLDQQLEVFESVIDAVKSFS